MSEQECQVYSFLETPDEVIKKACQDQCPDGYPMTIKNQDEWQAIADAVNQGIDAHLEALTERSSFDSTTGEVNVHPDELHVLLRRLGENAGDDEWSLRSGILSTLYIEEI